MRRKHPAQTLVEFALILPLLLMIIMGILDGSYYIYTWSQVQFAARRGAEQASKLAPLNIAQNSTDPCYVRVIEEIGVSGALVPIERDEVFVSYWTERASGSGPDRFASATVANGRQLGQVVQVYVDHEMEPLTPLGRSFFGDTVRVDNMSRRTILGLESPMAPTCQ